MGLKYFDVSAPGQLSSLRTVLFVNELNQTRLWECEMDIVTYSDIAAPHQIWSDARLYMQDCEQSEEFHEWFLTFAKTPEEDLGEEQHVVLYVKNNTLPVVQLIWKGNETEYFEEYHQRFSTSAIPEKAVMSRNYNTSTRSWEFTKTFGEGLAERIIQPPGSEFAVLEGADWENLKYCNLPEMS